MKINKLPTDWNLQPLTKVSFVKKRSLIVRVHDQFVKKWQTNKRWQTNSASLKQALVDYDKLQSDFANGAEEGYYYSLATAKDQINTKLKAEANQAREFQVRLNNQVLFFEHELAKLPIKTKIKFLQSKELSDYKYFLEKTFVTGKYLLTDGEEKILNMKEGVSKRNWIRMTAGFLSSSSAIIKDSKGNALERNFSEICSLIYSNNKDVRDQAAAALNDILKKYIKVGEAELNSYLENKKIDDELRGAKRADEIRLLNDGVDAEAIDLMLDIVENNNHLSHRFFKLKAKMLKLPKLKYHERGVGVGKLEKIFDYEQSCALVKKVLNDLNPGYAKIFDKFVSNGQIDVYPKKGKRSGAFCASGLISTPTYILLNHTNKLIDVLTVAHEVGHGINNEMMRAKQSALNFGSSLATAEVASTFFEDFVLKELIAKASDDERLILLMLKLNQDMATIFRQAALYKFELELNKQFRKSGYLSHEDIGQLFKKHMAAYMGKYVEQSEGSENWWLHWPHIRYDFYVYSYVSGLLISKHLQRRLTTDQTFIEKINYFLSAGVSEKPASIFKNMGIDISSKSFWQEGINEIKDLLDETERLAKRLKKI